MTTASSCLFHKARLAKVILKTCTHDKTRHSEPSNRIRRKQCVLHSSWIWGLKLQRRADCFDERSSLGTARAEVCDPPRLYTFARRIAVIFSRRSSRQQIPQRAPGPVWRVIAGGYSHQGNLGQWERVSEDGQWGQTDRLLVPTALTGA
jgi:hypothetical protein